MTNPREKNKISWKHTFTILLTPFKHTQNMLKITQNPLKTHNHFLIFQQFLSYSSTRSHSFVETTLSDFVPSEYTKIQKIL